MVYTNESAVLPSPDGQLRDCLQAPTASAAEKMVSLETEARKRRQLPNIAGAVPRPQPNVSGRRTEQALPRAGVPPWRLVGMEAQRKVQDETAQAGAQEIAQRCTPPVLG